MYVALEDGDFPRIIHIDFSQQCYASTQRSNWITYLINKDVEKLWQGPIYEQLYHRMSSIEMLSLVSLASFILPTLALVRFQEANPGNERAYGEFVEEFVGVKNKFIGMGPAREVFRITSGFGHMFRSHIL